MRDVRVGQMDTASLRSYFTIQLLDGTPDLIEAGGQAQISINGSPFNGVGISVLTAIGFGKYYADLDPTILTTPGDIIQTFYVSGTALPSFGDVFHVIPADGSVVAGQTNFDYYGTVDEGDAFFSTRLNGRTWLNADPLTKAPALRSATFLIDRLNYAGDKADPNQLLQFPRSDTFVGTLADSNGSIFTGDQNTVNTTMDVQVPQDVRFACYLIAQRIMDGYEPDMEAERALSLENKYGGASTKYNRSTLPMWLAAGIPSFQAWQLLRPYLRDPHKLELERES